MLVNGRSGGRAFAESGSNVVDAHPYCKQRIAAEPLGSFRRGDGRYISRNELVDNLLFNRVDGCRRCWYDVVV